jgi:DNA-binding Lrp family transcriptional regulator
MAGLPRLDRIDLRILAHLQAHGRISNVELAEAIGLSASPCLQRVKRLESAGYITGYAARINLARLGETLTVFTEVTLQDHRREDFIRFESALRQVEEVMECHLVSGGYDYLLRFLTRSIAHYQSVMESLLERDLGIIRYFSAIVIKTPLMRAHPPLDMLTEDRD